MSQESLPEEVTSGNQSVSHSGAFSYFPRLRPAPLASRSYSEIRKQMHLSLQARLNHEYFSRKTASFYSRTDLTLQENKKLWESLRRAAVSTALAQIKIDTRQKSLSYSLKSEDATPQNKTALQLARVDPLEAPKLVRHASLPQSLPSISIKEAMKDREWMSKNRERLLRYIACAINESNGVIVGESGEPYRYYVRKGNNSKLIKQLMKTRASWVSVKKKSDAQFVWSPKRELAILQLIPPCDSQHTPIVSARRSSVPYSSKLCAGGSKLPRNVNIRPLGLQLITDSRSYVRVGSGTVFLPNEARIHNRLENNLQLTHKKLLFANMKRYFEALGEDYTYYLPLTFHISNGESDPEFLQFLRYFAMFEYESALEDSEVRNLWILKPGENSNQGRDISVLSSIDQIRAELRSPIDRKTGQPRTFILQKYIDRPFLFHKRKFDIRCYVLVTTVNGVMQAYFYQEGYIRTSSREFSLKATWDRYVHLTNDAVQKNSEDYGKYENGNKVSFAEFQKYLDTQVPELQVDFQASVLPQIKHLAQSSILATFLRLNPKRRCCFEILGYDFMLDWKLRPLLIEVNTNPCLALVCPLLQRIIPSMVEGAFRIVLDSLFPDWTVGGKKTHEPIGENRWSLLFHEYSDGQSLYRTLQQRGTLSLLSPASTEAEQSADDEDSVS